ncbi:hypothetical protein MD484_g6074, partial [Candolleomyces efflorescens]
MCSFSYTLPEYRFTGARDLTALSVGDYDFLETWGAKIQPNHLAGFSIDIIQARQKHAKSMMSLQRSQMKHDFERIQRLTSPLDSVAPEELERKVTRLSTARTLWCEYLEEFLLGSDIFLFVDTMMCNMDGDDPMSSEEIAVERVNIARDALQEMLRICKPSSQLGSWSKGRDIHIDGDLILHWEM